MGMLRRHRRRWPPPMAARCSLRDARCRDPRCAPASQINCEAGTKAAGGAFAKLSMLSL